MKYKLNPDVSTDDLIRNKFKPGSWRHGDSNEKWYSKSCGLCGEIDLTVHINMTTKDWDEYEDTDVIDDDFGQPYTPFYNCVYNGQKKFRAVRLVIDAYYERMDALVDSGILVKV